MLYIFKFKFRVIKRFFFFWLLLITIPIILRRREVCGRAACIANECEIRVRFALVL